MKHRILLISTSRWFAVARLAMALDCAGFVVDAMCLAGHPVEKVRAVRRTYPYRNWAIQSSLKAALLTAQPDLVLPCDDLAVLHLHCLHRMERGAGPLAAVVERSLGEPTGFAVLESRNSLIAIAGQEGIPVPATDKIGDLAQLRTWLNIHGYPAVLKADGTSGGVGVRIIESLEQAERAFASLHRPPLFARAAKRLVIDNDGSMLRPWLLRTKPTVNAQSFIHGREASSTVACWKGEVLAAIHFEVLRTCESRGPASVLRVVDRADMTSSVEKLVRRLNLSGLCGFDFMIDSQTGQTMLIEMNARSTQTCHLALGPGRDPAAALWSAISSQPLSLRETRVAGDVIALFPQEWIAHPESTFLETAYHDVPWSEPGLMRACLASYIPQEKWYSSEKLTALYAKLPWYRA